VSTRGGQLGRDLSRLLTREGQTYEGADRGNAARIVALIWMLSALLELAYLPLDHPTAAIGPAGWALAASLVAASVAGGVYLLHLPPPGFNYLLSLSYLGLAQVAALEWLAGGASSAYQTLYLLWVGSATGVHPPRRALAFLGAAALVASAPLLYDGWSSGAATSIATDVLLWSVLGLIMLRLMVYVRAQRLRLQGEEEQAQRLARADVLTELGNRRAFDEALEVEMARSQRASSTVSVALVDIDGFKQTNDEYGHLEGDRCLRQAAEAVRRTMRGGDRGFRWGGDEFALLLPDTDHEGAEQAAARLASEVLSTCSDAEGRPLSVSWGAAETTAGMTAEELLTQADLALMGQKRERLQLEGPQDIRPDRSA
jgi:diguanylate cyclase (GGDEF)-like protein